MKRIISLLVLIFMAFFGNTVTFASDGILVTLDGEYIEFDVQPQIIDGRTMVPIRAIFEQMGASVTWDGDTGSAICQKEDTVVTMTLNSLDMYINNQVTRMDVAPLVLNGRTLAPARYVAEAFGANVEWDGEHNTVVIHTHPKVILYSLDGRTIQVFESEVPAYLNVGWYETLEETQQMLYAPDGRTITVFCSEVPAYRNVGWYESKSMAQAAGQPISIADDLGHSAADGYYYRTPTGKRYHLDPDCGGKNSYRTTNLTGLTPCKKCAQ